MAKNNPKRDSLAEFGVFALGGIVGIVAGVIGALWFAPQSGDRTRREIRLRGLEIRSEAERAAADTRARIEGTPADQLIADAKASARAFKDDAQQLDD
jgi:gas vesicle protein